MDDLDSGWQRKGATLSDKTARKARINRELKRLKTQVAALEERKARLIAELGK